MKQFDVYLRMEKKGTKHIARIGDGETVPLMMLVLLAAVVFASPSIVEPEYPLAITIISWVFVAALIFILAAILEQNDTIHKSVREGSAIINKDRNVLEFKGKDAYGCEFPLSSLINGGHIIKLVNKKKSFIKFVIINEDICDKSISIHCKDEELLSELISLGFTDIEEAVFTMFSDFKLS